jgi:hypothetical protein
MLDTMLEAEERMDDQPVLVTFVCRKCHASFQHEKKGDDKPSFFARLFGSGKVACPKCGSKELSEADTAPLTTKQYKKKQQAQNAAPKP